MSNLTKLHLIVAANPKAYSTVGGMTGGELVGTPEAFAFHLNSDSFQNSVRPGVFYSATIGNNGLAYYLPEDNKEKREQIRNELLRNFGTPLKINGQQIVIDSKGFIYEPQRKNIRWQFEAEGLRNLNEIRTDENLQEYLINSHKIILSDRDWSKDELHWLLIRTLRKLKKPIEVDPFLIKPNYKKERTLRTLNIRPNAYVKLKKGQRLPKADYENINKIESEILTEILSSKKKKFLEKTIHDIFKHRLFKKGFYIIDEGKTSAGRFDIAFKDEMSNLKVVEFKIGMADDETLKQLLGYMKKIEKSDGKDVIGIIVARDCKPLTLEKCKQKGIEFYPYRLKLNFPGLFD